MEKGKKKRKQEFLFFKKVKKIQRDEILNGSGL